MICMYCETVSKFMYALLFICMRSCFFGMFINVHDAFANLNVQITSQTLPAFLLTSFIKISLLLPDWCLPLNRIPSQSMPTCG